MKRLIQKSLTVIPVLVLGASVLFSSVASAAGTATVYLSPATGSLSVGNTIAINIYEDSGSDSVNAVQANLSYNSSVLTCSNSDITSSSAFGVAAQSTCGGGTVQIGRGASSPVTGAQLVATVRFTASAAGSANIVFTGGSSVVRSTDNGSESLSTTGGTYTVTAPVTPPAPTPPPAPNPTPPAATPPAAPGKVTPPPAKTTPPAPPSAPPASPTAEPTASPAASPTPPSNDNPAPGSISVSKITEKSATITWTTAVPTTTELDYGLNTQYGFTVVDKKLTTSHSVVLSSKILIPGSTFHYKVKGVDANGNLIASDDKTFATAKVGGAKKSSSTGAIIAGVVVLGLLAAGGGSLYWIKNGGVKPQWNGFEPAVAPPPTDTGAPAGQVVKPAGSGGEIKPGENIIKPGPGPNPPA